MKQMFSKNASSLFVMMAIILGAIAAPAMAATSTVAYDANNDNVIQKNEVTQAVADFSDEKITKSQLIGVVEEYFISAGISSETVRISSVSAGTVTRTFSASTVNPGDSITVTITPTPATLFDMPGYQVIETIPAGFTVTANTATASSNVGNVYTFTNIGSSAFTYTLTSPITEATYIFTGTFKDDDINTGIVTGSSIVTVGPPQPIGGILNPGFESGTASWIFYSNGKGTFTATSPGNEGTKAAKIALTRGGTNIQLYQTGITLEPNTRYQLSFSAYSTSGHDLSVNLIKHGSPYTNYGLDYTAKLGTSWKAFSTEFTTQGFTGMVNDGRLMFWLAPFAEAGDTYYIDDIRLDEIQNVDMFEDLYRMFMGQSLPESLDKFYTNSKPEIPSSEWVGEMFIQADAFDGMVANIQENDMGNATVSYEAFANEYKNISKKVPEWKEYFDIAVVDKLGKDLKNNNPPEAFKDIGTIAATCEKCMGDRRAQVWAKYYWRNFDTVKVNGMAWKDAMTGLAVSFGGIGANAAESQQNETNNSFNQFKALYTDIKGACSNCHDTPRYYYVSDDVFVRIDQMGKDITTGDLQGAQAIQQELGIQCYRCHVLHMPAEDMKDKIGK